MSLRLIVYGLIVSAVLAAFGLTYRAGYNNAAATCNAAALRAQLETLNKDLQASRNAARDAEQKAAKLDADASEANGRVDDLQKQLETIEAESRQPAADQPEPRVVTRTVQVPANCPAPSAPQRVRPSGPYRVTPDDVNRLR